VSLEDRSSRIRHESARPVWQQVSDDLAAEIASGTLPADTRLPSEAELSAQYGVARVSVRRAIADLRSKGLVVTVHGRGTYTAERP
jgi:DNA-binding GntR family transcriptional regulator